MIIDVNTMDRVIRRRSINIMLHGDNIEFINRSISKHSYKYISDKQYYTYKGNVYIDTKKLKKKELVDVLKGICISPNYYSDSVQKKVIIIINFHLLGSIYQQSVKTIIDMTYNNCSFIIHTNRLSSVDRNIMSRFIAFSLPIKPNNDETLQISYNKVIKLVKGNKLNNDVITTIRRLSYMYYMNHTHSTDLQKLLVKRIGSNLCIPNSIKYDLVEDISRINVLYQHSYRKPIFLELIIISLFKHLEYYTYNL